MSMIKVTKRNGKQEPVILDKILDRIEQQTYKLDQKWIVPFEVAQKVIDGITPGIRTSILDQLATETAAALATKHPDYSILAARLAINEIKGKKSELPPIETATGSLLNHITKGANKDTFQPMNVNFGLFPSVLGVKHGRRNRKERYQAYTERAKHAWLNWLK